MDFHTKSRKIKGNFKAKMKAFELNYVTLSPLKKFSTDAKVTTIVLRMLLEIIVKRRSKQKGHTTSPPNPMLRHKRWLKVISLRFLVLVTFFHYKSSVKSYCYYT